ncbi:NAD(+) hydrolase [Dirofilaria immitis]
MYSLVGTHYSCSDDHLLSASELTLSSDDEKRQQKTITDHVHRLDELEKEASIETLTDDLWFELDDDDFECRLSPSSSSLYESTRLYQSMDSAATIRPRRPPIALPPPPPRSAPPLSDSSQQHTVDAVSATSLIPSGSSPMCINGIGKTAVTATTSNNALIRQVSTVEDPCFLAHLQHKDIESDHAAASSAEIRLQQSLSTPCPDSSGDVAGNDDQPSTSRKESEYRRFKSEGSSAGVCSLPAPEMDVTIDDLSPIADPRSSSPSRLSLFQDTVTSVPLTKHSHTEQVMMMHTLKTKLSKYQNFIDKAFEHIAQGSDEQIIEGCTIIAKVMTKAWMFPKISHDLSYALCDYLRDQNYFDSLIMNFIKAQTCEPVRLACGRVLEECLSLNNREYVVNKGYLKKLVATAEKLNKNPEQQRMSLSIMESLFKHSTATTYRLIEYGVLDHILLTCKRATETPITLRHAALALANLSLYSCSEAKKKIIQKKVPDWLFLLASQPDDITRYYACLAICMLGSTKEMEAAVNKSGTLALVEPFLLAHQAITFAGDHYKHSQGRPKEWLERLLPMLKSKCREARSIAAFHFTMEATIKKDQQKLEVFQHHLITSLKRII